MTTIPVDPVALLERIDHIAFYVYATERDNADRFIRIGRLLGRLSDEINGAAALAGADVPRLVESASARYRAREQAGFGGDAAPSLAAK